MELIQQRFKYDCGVACVAMFCEVPYENVLSVARAVLGKRFDFNKHGITNRELIKICHHFGKNIVPVESDGCFDAIYLVPSMNMGGLHFVCKQIKSGDNKFKILDPSNMLKYANVTRNNVLVVFGEYSNDNVSARVALTLDIYKKAEEWEKEIKNGIL